MRGTCLKVVAHWPKALGGHPSVRVMVGYGEVMIMVRNRVRVSAKVMVRVMVRVRVS